MLTSATLSTDGDFSYIRERLGLHTAAELHLGSPFDYAASTLLPASGFKAVYNRFRGEVNPLAAVFVELNLTY